MGVVGLGVLQAATVVLMLVLLYRPLGDYIARIYSSARHLRVERGLYRLIGVDATSEQTWRSYARSVLLFSAAGMLLVYLLQRTQHLLPLSLGLPPVPEGLAFNTAASFVANTNWQSYSPEQTMGHLVQAAGLAVQNFLSAAVGIAIAITLVRGFARHGSTTIGNFWVDMTRGVLRLLLPISVVGALVLIAGGVAQNLAGFTEVQTLSGATQQIPGGPVASQEVIKLLGTNGGGFYNANSAHPFENPTPWTSLFEILLILAIPFSLPRAFGRMVGDDRQGYAIVSVMGVLFLASTTILSIVEYAGRGPAPELAGAALEGKEVRFGILGSTLFGSASTLTSTGAVNSMHDSYTALGGMMPMLNMMLGEVAPNLPALRADPVLLQRVLVNVLANAHRHTPPGSRVLVTTSRLGETAEIRIVDRGEGVPLERQQSMFAPFQREGDHDNTVGLGLGLALSRGFTEGMSGSLSPEDTPGGGPTMVIALPVASDTTHPTGADA